MNNNNLKPHTWMSRLASVNLNLSTERQEQSMKMKFRAPQFAAWALALLIASPVVAPSPVLASDLDRCMLKAIASADESTSIGELRKACATALDRVSIEEEKVLTSLPVYEQQDVIASRYEVESEIEERPFAITANLPNYILYTVMDQPNQAPFEDQTDSVDPVQDDEMQFQVSIKAPVWRQMFGTNFDTFVSYTSRSYWQLFNDEFSAPFRETNYEPEVFVRDFSEYDLLGLKIAGWSLGFNHQSNGQSQRYSRSWNRIMAKSAISITDDLGVLARAWYRIPEDEEDDDNPGMHRYYGYGDLRAVWAPNRNTVTAMLRPGTQETSFELTWSYPISKVFRIYAQYYNGYGESLLDYDYDMERFGIGIAMNDYLQRF
ncbi:phospholipase A [Pseudohalioglobus lutimaris]|uniref:Phospholipase A1 n=1 Tax=Pseudohalioglobus lutimaris TaxID=1737061 RepID=A0A2N5X5W4_9GAMM|nr:phospholipase A [Pseudohalioglobus lutimaris]PLW69884.1 phospholipase [Pseudohalioglobus lutimaris]